MKREYGSADVSANAVAAPATVCGEPTSFVPPGNREGGRWALTHKPGDLPSNVTHPPGGVALVVRTSAVTLFGPAVEVTLMGDTTVLLGIGNLSLIDRRAGPVPCTVVTALPGPETRKAT